MSDEDLKLAQFAFRVVEVASLTLFPIALAGAGFVVGERLFPAPPSPGHSHRQVSAALHTITAGNRPGDLSAAEPESDSAGQLSKSATRGTLDL